MRMRKGLRFVGALLAAVLLLGALAGCGKETASSGAGSAAPDGSEAPAEAKVFHVKDYGAVGDGVADDYNAVKKRSTRRLLMTAPRSYSLKRMPPT